MSEQEMRSMDNEICNLHTHIDKLEDQIAQLTKERDDEKKWSEELAKAVCEMEDVLGFKQDQTDEQGAMIPTFGPWKERVRDLLAKEGELGDMKEERDQLAAQLKEQSSHIRCIYCNAKYTAEQSGELADHILSCEKSPLVQMVRTMESRITDYMDLMNDEFMRIISICRTLPTDESEIRGICQRAMAVITQKEPVIKQRDDALDKLRLSESQVQTLLAEKYQLVDDTDEEWLTAIGTNHSFTFGKPWDTKDGETREEGLQNNIAALFQIIEEIRKEKDQLAAKCADLTDLARTAYGAIIEHHSSSQMREELIECPFCTTKRGDEILTRLHSAYTNPNQCGQWWISPEQKKVLVEAGDMMLNQFPVHAWQDAGQMVAVDAWKKAKKALEACNQ